MRPLLLPDDVVAVTPVAAADLHRGDVVAFSPPRTWLAPDDAFPFVMRVVALGGDQVEIRDGNVSVNGAQLAEPYVRDGGPTDAFGAGPVWHVPRDSVFVLGDNRAVAADSRSYGPIQATSIVGRVTFRCEPSSRRGPIG